jgi:hypothetical protein
MWQLRLSAGADLSDFAVRVVEDDEPADPHPLRNQSLTEFSEELRRRLYDQVVADFWKTGEPLPYSPEEAGVTVLYLLGRWLVHWTKLEIQDGAAEERSELLRIYRGEGGIVYFEV